MSIRRSLAIARAHARELSRRTLAVALLIGLPLIFYFAAFSPEIAISFATVGFGWSVAIVSLFSTHAMIAITPRLALAGYRPAEIIVGRILAIATYATVLGMALFLFLRTDSVVIADDHLFASIAFGFVGSATAGLAVGALLDREMEAMMILITIVALTLVVDWDSMLARVLPMHATYRHAWASVDGSLPAGELPWVWNAIVSGTLAITAIAATVIKVPSIKRASADK